MPHSPDPNVIEIRSKKPLEEAIKDQIAQIDEETAVIEAAEEEHRQDCMNVLLSAADLVQQGRLIGVMLIGLDPVSGSFLAEARMTTPDINFNDLYRYIGMLEVMKSDVLNAASLAPMMRLNGDLESPDVSYEDDYDD